MRTKRQKGRKATDADFKRATGEWRMKGTDKSVRIRRERAIAKRTKKGEKPNSSYELAKLFDALYRTDFVQRYHKERFYCIIHGMMNMITVNDEYDYCLIESYP